MNSVCRRYLEAGALVSQLPHPVQHQVHNLLADGVVAARVVVGGILFALLTTKKMS